jgi:hypothetical protein
MFAYTIKNATLRMRMTLEWYVAQRPSVSAEFASQTLSYFIGKFYKLPYEIKKPSGQDAA